MHSTCNAATAPPLPLATPPATPLPLLPLLPTLPIAAPPPAIPLVCLSRRAPPSLSPTATPLLPTLPPLLPSLLLRHDLLRHHLLHRSVACSAAACCASVCYTTACYSSVCFYAPACLPSHLLPTHRLRDCLPCYCYCPTLPLLLPDSNIAAANIAPQRVLYPISRRLLRRRLLRCRLLRCRPFHCRCCSAAACSIAAAYAFASTATTALPPKHRFNRSHVGRINARLRALYRPEHWPRECSHCRCCRDNHETDDKVSSTASRRPGSRSAQAV